MLQKLMRIDEDLVEFFVRVNEDEPNVDFTCQFENLLVGVEGARQFAIDVRANHLS